MEGLQDIQMKSLILLLFPIAAWSQDFMEQGRLYSLKMHVLETTEFGRYCTMDTTVIWGTNFGDTTCFLFNGRIKCFYNANRMVRNRWGMGGHGARAANETRIKQDQFNELYEIRFAIGNAGLVIFITNISFGMPSYVMSWSVDGRHGCTLCSH